MLASVSVSIVIATQDRASDLERTLCDLGKLNIPSDCKVELIVVDNGSKDQTAQLVRTANLPDVEVVYLYESLKGKSNALNLALEHARGEFILFTDDDVSVIPDWLDQMVRAMKQDHTHAVVGKIVLAPDVLRPWMTCEHRWWLAAPDKQADEPHEMIGANMGFRRSILERVPGFDRELGPGALGLGEEALFSRQLREAGFKIRYVPQALVIHRPEKSRLRRRNWLSAARKKGRQQAYISYHWEHDDIRAPCLKWFWYMLKLQLKRFLQPPPSMNAEGCYLWEMRYVQSLEACAHFQMERRRARNYLQRGLQKLTTSDLFERPVPLKRCTKLSS